LDNTMWDFKLLNQENGGYEKALHALMEQLDTEKYCEALFAKV